MEFLRKIGPGEAFVITGLQRAGASAIAFNCEMVAADAAFSAKHQAKNRLNLYIVQGISSVIVNIVVRLRKTCAGSRRSYQG
jgi:hypothetical protein